MKKIICSLSTLILLSACSSTSNDYASPVPDNAEIPDWVLKPSADEGIAASDCVKFSGNVSIDQKLVVANARSELAKQLTSRVETMDSTLSSRSSSNDSIQTDATFESVSKQITNETLVGSRPEVFGFAKINGEQYYCTLVSLGTEKTKALFDTLITANPAEFAQDEEQYLWEAFIAEKTEQSLTQQIERLTN